jgi:hypothetical protein
VPGFRLNVTVLVAPWNVGVAPRIFPEEDSIVMLWLSGAMLVNAIETLPAVAVSEVLLYFSWPSGFVWRLSTCPALGVLLAGTGVEDVAVGDVGVTGRAFGLRAEWVGAEVDVDTVLDVLGMAGWLAGVDAGGLAAGADAVAVLDVVVVTAALAGVEAGELVLLDEPPQPASASRPTARVSIESLNTEFGFA